MVQNWRDGSRARWRDDDRLDRDDDDWRRARRGGDDAGGAYGRRDRDDGYAARGYAPARGYGRGDDAGGGPRRGRWGREEDYASDYRNHYLNRDGRARDREEYGLRGRDRAERAGEERDFWSDDEGAGRRRHADASRDDEDGYRRGYRASGRYRDDW